MHILEKIREITAIARNVAIVVLIIILGLYIPKIASSISGATTAIGYTSRKADKFIDQQTKAFDNEKNKKAIEAGIAAAASFQATARLINTTTIPEINRTLLELQGATRSTNDNVGKFLYSVDNLVTDITPRVNEVFINVNGLLVNSNNSITSLTELINTTSAKTGLTLDELNNIIASDEWGEAVKHINESLNNIEGLTAELKVAGASAPGIAKSVEEIARTSSRYRKAVLLSQIISAIGRAFL